MTLPTSPTNVPRSAPKPGDLVDGKYSIECVLGEGGMGIVYRARHTKLEQPVAIKLMLPEMLAQTTLLARFEREARAAAKLKSRHAVRVYDVDVTPDGLPYMVMELLHGHDLAHELANERQLPVGRAVHVLLEVCSAIREAHDNGIVHRDLKPANVFLARDGDTVTAKVLDFGISKELVATAGLTSDGGVLGTVLYMSPEQVQSEAIDHRTDIWSLGAMLYELLAGVPPFDGPVTKVAVAIASHEPRPLRELRPDLPAGLGAVVRKTMAKRAADRYPNVQALMEALTPFSPSQSLDPYITRSSSPSLPRTEHPGPPTSDRARVSDTLPASDRIAAHAAVTTAGLSAEKTAGPRWRASRRAAFWLVPLAIASVALYAARREPAESAGRPSAGAMSAPLPSTSAAPRAAVVAENDLAPPRRDVARSAATALELPVEAGTPAPRSTGSAKASPRVRPTAPTVPVAPLPPAPSGTVPPLHL